ncbi:unnamed protein product [Orchesella dallaii]|uniref:Uncharacterized protein n=1 Tax=Orchesella dallaii TaxID=48710 RepID=A0ABP1QI83_9HEXA
MELQKFIVILAFTILSLSILVSGKPSSRRVKTQQSKDSEIDIAKHDDTSVTPSIIGSAISSNESDTSGIDSGLTSPTSVLKPKKSKKSHRLKHRRFGHHHKKHNRRSHNHRAGNGTFRRRHHSNSTKHDDHINTPGKVASDVDLPSSEQADLPSLKLLRNSRSGHRKFKRHNHHHHRLPNRRLGKKAKEQKASENTEAEA